MHLKNLKRNMKRQFRIKYVIVLMFISVNFEVSAGVKEAVRFAREGIERAVEIAPKVKKRKSFDSRSFYTGEVKVFYKVSVKRDTTNEIIIKSTGFSEIDEATLEIKISRIEKIDSLQNAMLLAWEMLNKKGFIKSDKKTDKVEMKSGNYIIEINVKFEGSAEAEIKIANIKIKVKNTAEEFESGEIKAIRRYRVSDGSFI